MFPLKGALHLVYGVLTSLPRLSDLRIVCSCTKTSFSLDLCLKPTHVQKPARYCQIGRHMYFDNTQKFRLQLHIHRFCGGDRDSFLGDHVPLLQTYVHIQMTFIVQCRCLIYISALVSLDALYFRCMCMH